MSDVSGTLGKVTLKGFTFDVAADVDVTEIVSNVESEMIPTSGRPMNKRTKRVPVVEGLVLICNDSESEILKTLAEDINPFPMSYTNAAEVTYTAEGSIEYESRTTQENRSTIKLQPRFGWTKFI